MPNSILFSRSLVQQDKSDARLTTKISVKAAFLALLVILRTPAAWAHRWVGMTLRSAVLAQ